MAIVACFSACAGRNADRTAVLPTARIDKLYVDQSGVLMEFSSVPGTLLDGQQAAVPGGWVAERCTLDAAGIPGPWSVLGGGTLTISEERVGAWRLKDAGIAPKTRYRYRLKAASPVSDAKYSAPVDVRTLGDFRWKISHITPRNDRVEIGLMVFKYERRMGREVLGRFSHREGDTIGVSGEEGNLHPAWDASNPGRPIKDGFRQARLDFNTGARIVRIETLDVEIEVSRCRFEIAAAGWQCLGVETRPELFKGVHHVVIADDEKVQQDWWKITSRWTTGKSNRKGLMCPEHADPDAW